MDSVTRTAATGGTLMTGQLDLQVDTEWIRRAAATLGEAARGLRAAADRTCTPSVLPGALGGSPDADAVVRLVNLRTTQAGEAAAQLGSIGAGLAARLVVAADRFDECESAIGSAPR